jgi:hypothetical protein
MSIRDRLRTAGRVGYQVLDNIIGFDDDYDTVGELLARSLREDPLGTAGSIAGGFYESAKGAVTQPVQTAREVADEFADAYFRLREGLPEDATRDDIGQLTEDLTLFGSLVPAVGATARTVRATTRAAPEVELDLWSNVDFDDGSEPPEDWLDDIVFGQDPDAALANAQAAARAEQRLARRDAFVAALGGEEAYQNALRGFFDMDPADYDEAAQNLAGVPVLGRTVFDPEDGPMPEEFTLNELAGMNPDAVRALIAQAENDPAVNVYLPELAEMLADMTQQELAEITGLPIPTYAGAWNPNLPPPPAEIDFGPTIEQLAAGADNPFGDVNPWTNVQDAEDLAANFQWDVNDDPFRGLTGSRVLADTAPAASNLAANPYMPTPDFLQRPQTWLDQGIAGVYSRSGRAADQLRQPRYSDITSLRRELEARGASPSELNYQLGQFEEAMVDGPVSREDIQRFFSDYDTGLRVDRTLKFTSGYMPSGGRNATSTVYYHPEGREYPSGAKRHYDDIEDNEGRSAVPLFHSRAAQYDLGFPGGGTTHHVAEIQSDFSQYRQTLPKDARDAFDQQYDAPYIRRENDWVDASIRQNLLDAVNSGSDWITFGNGKQANTHIGMPLEAAKSFYDTRVPRRIEDVLRRFANQSGINAPELERIPFVDGDDVLGFRITPEFRDALIKNGLPSYKNGGIVSLRNH